MGVRYSPRWLPRALAGAVIAPAVATLGWAVYGVHGSDGWSEATDAPGFALCGTFALVPVAVAVVWLAARAYVRRDASLHAAIAAGCGLGAAMATISLGEAGAVALGLQEGRVPIGMLAAMAGTWTYFVAAGLGHWHLSRTYRRDGPGDGD